MPSASATQGAFTLKAYRGDRKTLLAFNLADASDAKNLAGFTIHCQPGDGSPGYYILNELAFANPADHAQVASEPARSSVNAPIHKFRWVHVLGSAHQGLQPFLGDYAYTVTPRYFDGAQKMLPLDPSLSASVTLPVDTFTKGKMTVGFTRGYMQSEAFVHHFGDTSAVQPAGKPLIFDTTQKAGTGPGGQDYSWADQYQWMGWTARELVFAVLDEVVADASLRLDVFAYDLDEPDVITRLETLAKAGRLRIILDNASLHTNRTKPTPEDQTATLLTNAGGAGVIKRGKFGRYAHDKVFVVSNAAGPVKALTGSTNFSITGLYVNANHVLLFDEPGIAGWYAGVFDEAWNDNVAASPFRASAWATQVYSSTAAGPQVDITFSPHTPAYAESLLMGIVDRINAEGAKPPTEGSVLFAVMEINQAGDKVYDALNDLHKTESIFTYGISDAPEGVYLYPVGSTEGVLVTGKSGRVTLPPPFDQVPVPPGHEIHDKFVVCGMTGDDGIVYCGSSNLAEGGEAANGDNLLAIHDSETAAAFGIEALALIDHYDFLDSLAAAAKAKGTAAPANASKSAASAAAVGWTLGTTDAWAQKYFDPKDLHFLDRNLFG